MAQFKLEPIYAIPYTTAIVNLVMTSHYVPVVIFFLAANIMLLPITMLAIFNFILCHAGSQSYHNICPQSAFLWQHLVCHKNLSKPTEVGGQEGYKFP